MSPVKTQALCFDMWDLWRNIFRRGSSCTIWTCRLIDRSSYPCIVRQVGYCYYCIFVVGLPSRVIFSECEASLIFFFVRLSHSTTTAVPHRSLEVKRPRLHPGRRAGERYRRTSRTHPRPTRRACSATSACRSP